MAEQNNEKIITTDTLYTFKLEQDLQNLEKFKLKSDSTDLKGAVRYDAAQALTEEQKAQARANIGAGTSDVTQSGEGAVRYDVQQALDGDEKARARENIGAGTSNFDGDYNSLSNRTHYQEGVEIAWDGNLSGKESVVFIEDDVCIRFVKVNDKPISDINNLIGATLTMLYDDGTPKTATVTEQMFTRYNSNIQFAVYDSAPALFNVIQPETIEVSEQTISFTSAGVYFVSMTASSSDTQSVAYIKSVSSVVYHKLNDKFIPDSIPRLDENGKLSIDNIPELGFYDDVVEGYYNPADYLFYEEAEFKTAITGESGKIYVDKTESNSYRYSGTIFVRINPPEYTLASNEDIYALFNK